MSRKTFDGTTQKMLGVIAVGLAMILIYAAASEANWLPNTDQPVQIDLPAKSDE